MSTNKRKDQKSFTMYFPEALYHEVKEVCELRGMTMKKYIMRALISRMNMEKKQSNKLV